MQVLPGLAVVSMSELTRPLVREWVAGVPFNVSLLTRDVSSVLTDYYGTGAAPSAKLVLRSMGDAKRVLPSITMRRVARPSPTCGVVSASARS